MACSCRGRRTNTKFVWTNGVDQIIYNTEIEAKARVLRKGGTYKPKEG